MRYLLFIFSLLFVVFFNTAIASSFGLEKITTIAFMPMLIFIVFNIYTRKLRYDSESVHVIILAVIIFIFKTALGQGYYIMYILELLMIPMLMSICFEHLTKKELTLLFRVIIILFIVECGLSIVEFILQRNIFVTELLVEIIKDWEMEGFFRSTSLYRHPLANAQIVAVLMTFIALYNFKKKRIQILLFLLGYVSLFCFSARGATLVVSVFTVPYVIWKINKTAQPSQKRLIKFGIFCMFCGMIYLITQTSLGGRLMNMELMDSSGGTRLSVFKFYTFYQKTDDFLWGHPTLYLYMKEKLGAGGVENGVIALILEFGIIFTIPMLFLLFRFQYQKLSVYINIERWILLAVFFLIGTMNPNLSNPTQWTIWILAYYAFRPDLQHKQDQNITDVQLSQT